MLQGAVILGSEQRHQFQATTGIIRKTIGNQSGVYVLRKAGSCLNLRVRQVTKPHRPIVKQAVIGGLLKQDRGLTVARVGVNGCIQVFDSGFIALQQLNEIAIPV